MKNQTRWFIAVMGLYFVLNVQAQNVKGVQGATRYSTHVQVISSDRALIKDLVKNNPELIVDHVSAGGFELYGPPSLKEFLKKQKLLFVEIPPLKIKNKKFELSYPTSEQVIQKLQALQQKYPTLIKLEEIGKSVQGRPLMFARITSPAGMSESEPELFQKPEFKYVANMHGDEIAGRELMVSLIEDLAINYGKDARITKLLDAVQIYIMPSMNPDGANAHNRFNANSVDLNRSFPDFTTSDNANTFENREPEIQAMMKFQARHSFKLSANFHGGAEVVNYPWDTEEDAFPLDNFVKKISTDYAQQVSYLRNSNDFPGGITNGYAWYEVDGGMQDWSYHWHNDIQLTIELTKSKWPDYSTISKTYQDNRNALLGLIEEIDQI